PAATMAALARLAKTGVLIKRGSALETLAGVKRIVFDKTGTLTYGQLSVGAVIPLSPDISEERLLQLAATAESKSEHPIAQAILKAASTRLISPLRVNDFTATPGSGITAKTDAGDVYVGTLRFLRENN